MNRFLRLFAAVGALGLGGCCGDTEATLQVHVVDGENGAQIQHPVIVVDGNTAFCTDTEFQSAPEPTDDGGTVVPPPPGADGGVPPPPSTHFCDTWMANVDPGEKTVKVSAAGYFATEVQEDFGSEGGSFSCPSPRDVEITVALYKKPN
jgi:hypothetical protein